MQSFCNLRSSTFQSFLWQLLVCNRVWKSANFMVQSLKGFDLSHPLSVKNTDVLTFDSTSNGRLYWNICVIDILDQGNDKGNFLFIRYVIFWNPKVNCNKIILFRILCTEYCVLSSSAMSYLLQIYGLPTALLCHYLFSLLANKIMHQWINIRIISFPIYLQLGSVDALC